MDIETIERLAALRDKGVITEEEFQREKLAYMGHGTSGQPVNHLPDVSNVHGRVPAHPAEPGYNRGKLAVLLLIASILLEVTFTGILAKAEPDFGEIIGLEIAGAVIATVFILLLGWWAFGGRSRVGSILLLVVSAGLTLATILIGFDEHPSMDIPIVVLTTLASLAAFQHWQTVGDYYLIWERSAYN